MLANEVLNRLQAFRPACARVLTWLWLAVALLGLCARPDIAGVSSLVRGGFLDGDCYRRLLHMMQSTAVDLGQLTREWLGVVLTVFKPLEAAGYRLAVADGVKAPKEGRRMPAVKSLHQESNNNSKPPYIMGHSFQAVGLLVEAAPGPVCVPLASRLHEGVKAGPGETRTLLDKLVLMFLPLASLLATPVILIADAYYATRKVILPLLAAGHQLLTRVRSNCVAYELPARPARRRPGRPRVYGKKVRLADMWSSSGFVSAPSPAYREENVTIRYLVKDLLWRPVGRLVRFVLVEHPRGGRVILMTTLLSLEPLQIIRLYSYRFKIEVGFKQALRTVGAYAYHFWMKSMPKRRRGDGDQFLHRATPEFRQRVRRKLAAYELHVQLGCIAQGFLQHLAINHRAEVWANFRSWMRTMRTDRTPSEAVAAQAFRDCLPEFLRRSRARGGLAKFLRENVDWWRIPGAAARSKR